MESVLDRFLRYTRVDTESSIDSKTYPSTAKQLDLSRMLKAELEQIGASNVKMDEYGYVTAEIPATAEGGKTVAFLAHMDTVEAASGANVKAQVVRNYQGGDIVLNEKEGWVLSPKEFPYLEEHCIGKDLVTTDGTTLLGADDKAGIAEIMTMAEYFIQHPEIAHGTIKVGFNPDEEIGRGMKYFDVEGFNADYAYTVDGGAAGSLSFETFNAARAEISIRGVSIHTGSARGKMQNALLMGMELHQMLPVFENPASTDVYQGFFHLDVMSGSVDHARMGYILRDHDRAKFEQKKALMVKACEFMNAKYGEGAFELTLEDTYYNMREKIEPCMFLIDYAKEAMAEVGMTPSISPIRGGTDGSALSFRGLPCPNLCTGGQNAHGRLEYIPVQEMEQVVELLIHLAPKFLNV